MATPKRIYHVTDSTEGGGEHLVRASTPAAAIHHVVRNRYRANVAAQDTIVDLLGAGQKVEDASQAAEAEQS